MNNMSRTAMDIYVDLLLLLLLLLLLTCEPWMGEQLGKRKPVCGMRREEALECISGRCRHGVPPAGDAGVKHPFLHVLIQP